MKDDLFSSFKTQFETLQENTRVIRERAESMLRDIADEKLISAEAAESLASELDMYKNELLRFNATGKELAIDIDTNITSLRNTIIEHENKQKMIAERQLVLDYLRLCTMAENTIAQLEESKRLLSEKCRSASSREDLQPFRLVVKNVKDGNSRIPDEVFDAIEAGIGKQIARATDRGELEINEAAEVSQYLDGSCELLMPLTNDSDQIKEASFPGDQTKQPPQDETPSAPQDNPVILSLWGQYDGFIDDETFDVPDIPSIHFNDKEFTDAGILPKSFILAEGESSRLFSLRLNLIKQYIRNAGDREQGLNLISIEPNRDMPCVCWADNVQSDDSRTLVHYILPCVFSRKGLPEEIEGIGNLIDNTDVALITLIAISNGDKAVLQTEFNSNDSEGRISIAVLKKEQFVIEAASPENESAEEAVPTPEVDAEYITALNRIKDLKASAAAFLSDINRTKIPILAREILTLLSYFGVVVEDSLAQLANLYYGFQEKREPALHEVLNTLVSKNILASYEYKGGDADTILYCLTQYGYSCIHKDTVMQDLRRRLNQKVGNCRFVGRQEMELGNLYYVSARTMIMECVLADALEAFGEQTLARIVTSISATEDCGLSMEFPYHDEFCRFEVVYPNEAKPDINQFIIDVESKSINDAEKPEAGTGKILLYRHHELYDLDDDRWVPIFNQNDADEEPQEHISTKESIETPAHDEMTAILSGDIAEKSSEDSHTAPEEEEAEESTFGQLKDLLATEQPNDEQFSDAIVHQISEQTIENSAKTNYNALANAIMLAKAASFADDRVQVNDLYKKLLAATNIPLDDFEYTGENLSTLFAADTQDDEALKLSAYSHAMFAPQEPYDYTLNGVCDQFIKDYDRLFPSFPRYKGLFIKFNEIRSLVPEGFSSRVLGLLDDQAERQERSNAISRKAAELCEVPGTNTTNLPGHQETLNDCFGPDSEIGWCMKVISENKTSDRSLVEDIYQSFCKDNGKIVQSKIDDVVDEIWRKHRKHKGNLVSKGKVQVDNAYRARLEVVKAWLDSDVDASNFNTKAIKTRSAELIKEIDKELSALKKVDQKAQPMILYWALQSIKSKLELKGSLCMVSFFSDILFTGIISMSDDGLPILEKEMDGVKYYEPWRNVIRHIMAPRTDADTVKSQIIYESDSPCFDNYRQLRMLGQYLGSDSDEYAVDSEDLDRAKDTADATEREFRQQLESAYTYDRIGEPEKEQLSALLGYKEQFYAREDFACWKSYLHALSCQLNEMSEKHRDSLINRLEGAFAKLDDGEKCPLLDEVRRLLEEHNYAVSEEYLNRFDAGERELTAETNLLRNEERTFEEFVSPEVYNPIFAACSRKAGKTTNFRGFAVSYVTARFPKEWTSRYKDDAKEFLSNWPFARDNTTPENILLLLRLLGLDVTGVDKVKLAKVQHFKANVRSTPRNKPDYQHPISAFGTQTRTPVNVLVLYGKNDPAEIVNKVNNMNLGNNTIVFIDYPLALADRRAVAEYFHKSTSGQNTFLLIDQVLAIFLALKSTNERLPAFLKCTLPFTRYQPFVFDGGPTSDDMFCGRVSELQKILDPQGACVVYGGRQLGKTALLQRAESLRSKPEDLHYAVYTNIIKMTSEKEVVERIAEDINKKTPLRLKPVESIRDLTSQINTRFQEGAARSMLLLIDEADDFLESISSDMYKQLQPLVDLKRDMHNEFKFVLAGLHNVYRTKNATDRNGVFGQLGMPLCIKPLSPTDALQLISRPLMYLGFQVDRYPHLETILTNTNYYPGILQFFGYNLVQSVPAQYGEYFSAKNGNPPFTLEEKQLSAIMTSNDLNNSIKEKFRLSLKLDTRYFMLARVIALMYFENDVPETSRDGFTAAQILDNAKELGIHCLEHADYTSAENLLDEMVEMGILNRIDKTKGYCLRRRSFLNIIGANADSLLDEIVMENKETD